MAYISVIETGNANLTCKNIDFIAKSFNIKPELLFNDKTTKLNQKLPARVDRYNNHKIIQINCTRKSYS